MCWESFDVVRFDLGPLVQGQTTMPKLKSAYISLILVILLVKRGWSGLKVPIFSLLLPPEVWNVKVTLNSKFLLPGGRSYHCSGLVPTQLLQPVTELTNRLLAIQFSLSNFASHQLVTEATDLTGHTIQ